MSTTNLADCVVLTIYPLTLFSSIANVLMAACILSKLVAFQTKSTEKPWVQSIGTPSFRRSSRQISSETSADSQT
jgi:hypothetical protein